MRIAAFITGIAGYRLTVEEAQFIRDHHPWGFILFARNIDDPAQVKALTAELRECCGRQDAPILIDQEGGRVQRLRPPHWPQYPAPGRIGELFAHDPAAGRRAAWLQSRLIAADLAELGITVNCLPVLDVPVEEAHDVVGDRAYSTHPFEVAELGRSACEGLIAGGVLPVIKHIPGHGRAHCDSHLQLPRVDTHPAILGCTDFYPFMQLADMPIAMTAHIVYSGFDPDRPATASAIVIDKVIRGWIGYEGLLLSDDISMNALSGDLSERAQMAFGAGCDIVLHCNGDIDEMRSVASVTPDLIGVSEQRAKLALERLEQTGINDDLISAMRTEFDSLMNVTA